MLLGKRIDTRTARSYADMHNIAEKALNALKQGEYTLFTAQELKMICFDYTFAVGESVLEHLGYILHSNWDSKKEHRHYSDKREKLLHFYDTVINHVIGYNYPELEIKWQKLISSFDLENYAGKRNPIKHPPPSAPISCFISQILL